MHYNKKLSIAIPTYNRPEILEVNLNNIIDDIIQYNIAVYVSDDSDDTKTEEFIARLKNKYSNIFYVKNCPALGHDKNFFHTIGLPDTEFVWYIGDSMMIKKGVLAEILNILECKIDLFFVNYLVKDRESRFISNQRDFIVERAWYLTLSGATIYGEKMRKFCADKYSNDKWRNFVQLGVIFDFILTESSSIYWYGKSSIELNRDKKSSYWVSKVFDVFVNDWMRLINSFGSHFTSNETRKLIASHAIQTKLFSIKRLLLYRAHGGLSIAILSKNFKNFIIAAPLSSLVPAVLISFLPKKISGDILYFLKRIFSLLIKKK